MWSQGDLDLTTTILEKFEKGVDLRITEDFAQVDVILLKSLLKLINDRKKTSLTTDEEYLEKKLQNIGDPKKQEGQIEDNAIKDVLFRMYLTYRKHESAVDDIALEYFAIRKPSLYNTTRVIVFILIIYLDKFNVDHIRDVIFKFNTSLAKKIVEFLSSANLEKTMCRYFDREYVDEILKVSTTQEILRNIHDEIQGKSVDSDKTKKLHFECKPFKTHYHKPVELSKPNPEIVKVDDHDFIFKANPIPYDILKLDQDVLEREKEDKLNRRKMEARNLQKEANKNPFRAAKLIGKKKESKEVGSNEIQMVNKFKAKQVQYFPPVDIKTNAAQTLREAANIKKEEEKFEKMIIGLTNGSLGNFDYENYVEELRKQKEMEELETIERRKLQTLITHEEAILARQRLIEKNKNEKQEFRKQWEEYETKMNEIREKDMQELKLLAFVETKQREQNIQEKMKNMVEEKCKLVQEEHERIKEDQNRKMKELIEDMERKKELIRRIKLLQEIAKLNNECRVRFDETEVMNNGFMYEMSLAELRVRLSNMELEMKEELEKKKCEISQEKLKKQKLLEETSKLIEDNRHAKRELRKVQEEMKNQCGQKKSVNMNANMDLKLKLIQIRQERIALKNQVT